MTWESHGCESRMSDWMPVRRGHAKSSCTTSTKTSSKTPSNTSSNTIHIASLSMTTSQITGSPLPHPKPVVSILVVVVPTVPTSMATVV